MNKKLKNIKMELLAPAGGKEQFIAAVENGTDAIYMGGSGFNARMGAENFTLKDMEEAVDYAHLRGVKTYITMNTLMEDKSLAQAMEHVRNLYRIGADGIIVQDLGLGSMIKSEFPDFPMHFSTQGTIYNALGAREIKKLGYARVVLAREMSLAEIEKCSEENIETEVFVHGAMCFCYSGQCHLSRYMGGRSGNKGVCAQPCRLLYSNEGKGQERFLSPKDLSLIDYLKELREAGVSSLKIEGRMKSPHYVATVVSIYRKYLDMLYDRGEYEVSQADRESLAQAFNRGGFTQANISGKPDSYVFSGDVSKNGGVFLGKILGNKYSHGICEAELVKDVKIGDILEVRGKRETSFMLTYLKEKRKGVFAIGDIKDEVSKGDSLYRIISKDMREEAEKTFRDKDFHSGKSTRKSPVTMELYAYIGGTPVLKVESQGKIQEYEEEDFIVEEAVNSWKDREAFVERVMEQLSKTGNTPFKVENPLNDIKIKCDENIYLPIKLLNQMRRKALDSLEKQIKESFKRNLSKRGQDDETFDRDGSEAEKPSYITKDAEENWEKRLEIRFNNIKDFFAQRDRMTKDLAKANIDFNVVYWVIPLKSMMEKEAQLEAIISDLKGKIIPYVPNVTEGKMDLWLKENQKEIMNFIKKYDTELYIGNLSHLAMFREKDIVLLADYGLNIYNKKTLELLKNIGVNPGVMSLEVEDVKKGRYPLMTTQWKMPVKEIKDRKGETFRIELNEDTEKTDILSASKKPDFNKIREALDKGQDVIRVYT